jgi:hypothetical protein
VFQTVTALSDRPRLADSDEVGVLLSFGVESLAHRTVHIGGADPVGFTVLIGVFEGGEVEFCFGIFRSGNAAGDRRRVRIGVPLEIQV